MSHEEVASLMQQGCQKNVKEAAKEKAAKNLNF